LYHYPDRPGKWSWNINGRSARDCLRLFAEKCLLKQDLAQAALEMISLMDETIALRGKRAVGKKVVTDTNLRKRQMLSQKARGLQAAQYTRV
jgi:hypothetical protein